MASDHARRLELGLILPTGDAEWVIEAKYEAAGYIEDDDARDWNVDDLYKSLKEGTAAANEEREKRGINDVYLLRMEQLFLVAFFASTLDLLFDAGAVSIVPAVLRRAQLTEGNTLLNLNGQIAKLVGTPWLVS